MSELERIGDQLKRAFYGNAWHGPSLREVLDGVNTKMAATRLTSGHSIREIVLHITAWTEIASQRLAEDPIPDATDEEDWPLIKEVRDEDWKRDIDKCFAAEERLQELLRSFPEVRLDTQVPGRDHSFYVMLQGVVQHCLYHAGQIAVLKKAMAA